VDSKVHLWLATFEIVPLSPPFIEHPMVKLEERWSFKVSHMVSRGDFMTKCLCPNKCLRNAVLFPLIGVSVVPIAFFVLTVYLAVEQSIAGSVTQAVNNIPYGSVSIISLLLFFVGALVLAIARVLYISAFCLRASYATWQERKSRGTNDLKG
jgi:hypothetical protein